MKRTPEFQSNRSCSIERHASSIAFDLPVPLLPAPLAPAPLLLLLLPPPAFTLGAAGDGGSAGAAGTLPGARPANLCIGDESDGGGDGGGDSSSSAAGV